MIYFGGNSLTSYNLTDPRSGSIIDNADISYITRIEQQGGGIVYGVNSVAGTAFVPTYDNLFGLPLTSLNANGTITTIYSDQYNSPKSLTVSNSNFNDFLTAGFYAHPGPGSAIIAAVNFTTTTPVGRTSNYNGEPTHDYFYNDTFSNMPTGVYILSQSGADVLKRAVAGPTRRRPKRSSSMTTSTTTSSASTPMALRLAVSSRPSPPW